VISKEEFYAAIDGHPRLRVAYFRAVNATVKSLKASGRYAAKPGIWSRAWLGQAKLHATSAMNNLLDGFEFEDLPLRASDKVTLASLVKDNAKVQLARAEEKTSRYEYDAPHLQPNIDDIKVLRKND